MTSTENHPDEPEVRAPEGAAPEPANDPATTQPATSAAAPTGEGHEASESDADDDHDDGGEGEGTAQEGGTAAAGEAGAPQAGQKKKRRRRRKKKTGDAAAAGAPGAEGAAAAGGEAGATAEGEAGAGPRKDRPKKKDRPREPRERPAFNVGDVVFGKIVEITDDVAFIDVAGKARAIFDKKEMELPDDVEWGADPEAALDEEAERAEKAAEAQAAKVEGAETPITAANPPEEAPAKAVETTPTEATSEYASATPVEPAGTAAPTAPEGALVAEQAAAETGTTAATEEKPAAAPAAPAPSTPVELPPVTMEVGANFVGIVHNDGGRGGLVVLTRHPKRVQRAKLIVGGAFKERGEILGLVTGVIKGGVEVDVDGLRAFAPGSHMDLRLGADLHHLVGKRMLFVVTQYAKRGRDVVLSRRPFLEEEAKLLREAALSMLEIGSVVEGTVRSVVPFGAFVDVGGIEGLVELREMSHNRGDSPHDVFKVGEKTTVKILRVDERGKVWLSRKAAIPDPWGEVAKKYPQGSKHTGKVARLQPFGVFVELEPGIDGLIHTADLSMKRIEHPSEVVKEGDSIEVVVVHLEPGQHRIGLHPAPTGEAANETPQRVVVHKPVKVAVVGYEPNGLIVRVLGATGRSARGWIGAAATGTPRGTELRKAFPMGTQLDAKVMEIDPKRGEVKLSVRALSEDTERSAYRQYREQVQRDAKFGTFGDLLKKNLQQKN
jgi:small subunit ribosomal protein S1